MFIFFLMFHNYTYDVDPKVVDPKEKVINRERELNNANEVENAKEVSMASFEHETNGAVLCVVPIPIIHRSQDEIDGSNVCQRLRWEGQNHGKLLNDVSLLVFLLQEILCC